MFADYEDYYYSPSTPENIKNKTVAINNISKYDQESFYYIEMGKSAVTNHKYPKFSIDKNTNRTIKLGELRDLFSQYVEDNYHTSEMTDGDLLQKIAVGLGSAAAVPTPLTPLLALGGGILNLIDLLTPDTVGGKAEIDIDENKLVDITSWGHDNYHKETIKLENSKSLSHSTHLRFGKQWKHFALEKEINFYRLNFNLNGKHIFHTDNYNLMSNTTILLPILHNVTPYLGFGFGLNISNLQNSKNINNNNKLTSNGQFTYGDLHDAKNHTHCVYQLSGGMQVKILSALYMNINYKFLSSFSSKGLKYESIDAQNKIARYSLKLKNHFLSAGLKFIL